MRPVCSLFLISSCVWLAFDASSGGRPVRAAENAPAPPQGFSGVVLRIEFLFPERRIRHIGTGFVIQDHRKEKYLLTCAHLVDERDWHVRYRVTMRTMKGDRRIESYGTSLHVGQSIDLRQRGASGQPDMTKDLVIRPAAGEWAKPLRLRPPIQRLAIGFGRSVVNRPLHSPMKSSFGVRFSRSSTAASRYGSA